MQTPDDDGIELTEEEKKFIPCITPSHVLLFATGATNIPSVGFDPNPVISFVHEDSKNIPSAQTCSNMLYIYVNKNVIDNSFAHYLLIALMNGGV